MKNPRDPLADLTSELENSGIITESPELQQTSSAEMEALLNAAETKASEHWDKLLRIQAEMENLRRRTEREVSNAHKYALEKFAYELLNIVDTLERSLTVQIEGNSAVKDMQTGIELTLKMFLNTLQKFGVTAIDPMGATFNPELHTAIAVTPNPDVTNDTVIQVTQKGYLLKDRLLRPASVVVVKNEN